MNWKLNKNETKAVLKIADRAVKIAEQYKVRYDKMDAIMDITACHNNGCPLEFTALSKADDFNLAHDAFGIRKHLNRTTGKLEGCFLPRYATPEKGQQ